MNDQGGAVHGPGCLCDRTACLPNRGPAGRLAHAMHGAWARGGAALYPHAEALVQARNALAGDGHASPTHRTPCVGCQTVAAIEAMLPREDGNDDWKDKRTKHPRLGG